MYLLRFKRHRQPYVFLAMADLDQHYIWTLTEKVEEAVPFATLPLVQACVEEIEKIEIPKKAFDFNASTLFLIRLFGSVWDDQVEGMLIDMEDVIKAQIIDQKGMFVTKTLRMRNPVWEKHYA